jgi:hypothetical protein
MAKIVAWLVLIFLVLMALRLINMRNHRARRREAGATQSVATGDPTVRCVHCGVFLPRGEARAVSGGFACADGQCAER